MGWALRGIERGGDLDGLPTIPSGAPEREPAPPHPNGAIAIDHVVARTPDLGRTLAALQAAGLTPRRVREAGAMRQAFFVLGGALLELVGPPEPSGEGPARFWGLVAAVADLDAACARLGPGVVEAPRAAVQPGRRIAVVKREAGLGTAFALMSPR